MIDITLNLMRKSFGSIESGTETKKLGLSSTDGNKKKKRKRFRIIRGHNGINKEAKKKERWKSLLSFISDGIGFTVCSFSVSFFISSFFLLCFSVSFLSSTLLEMLSERLDARVQTLLDGPKLFDLGLHSKSMLLDLPASRRMDEWVNE